jgi:hypothetical protein
MSVVSPSTSFQLPSFLVGHKIIAAEGVFFRDIEKSIVLQDF